MKLRNILFIHHSIDSDMNTFIKEKIAEELDMSVDDVYFDDIKTPDNATVDYSGFAFIWDGETQGTVRISFGNVGGIHICIEAQYSWEAVELYNLINDWLDEFDQD